jgi:DNA-directed RNA polymerase specialized sigma24 family protein
VVTAPVLAQIYPRLRARAFELTQSDADADDLTQLTVLQLLERPPAWEGTATQTLHYARLRMRTLFHREFLGRRLNVATGEDWMPVGFHLDEGEDDDARETAWAEVRPPSASRARRPVDRRPAAITKWEHSEQAKVWKLRHEEGLKLTEIAARTGKALGTVKATLHQAERARGRLGLVPATHGV